MGSRRGWRCEDNVKHWWVSASPAGSRISASPSMATPSPRPNPSFSLRAVIRRVLDRVLGHDFFVAYGHLDGTDFPRKLYQALKDQRFSVFLDEAGGYHGGAEIDRGTQRFAGNARRLIIVAGPAALESSWVLEEVAASQRRRRDQIVIDDPDQTFQNAPPDHRFKKLLGNRKWLKRSRADDNLSEILVDLASGFTAYRQETRSYLLLGGGMSAVLIAALVSIWLGYEGQIARQQATTARLLASTGRLTTQVEAALRAVPPRREHALRLALRATRDTLRANLPLPNSTEQALRNAIAGSGGLPVRCGADNPRLIEAPRQLGAGGPLIAAALNKQLCIWDGQNLSFLHAIARPDAVSRALYVEQGRLWEVDRTGRLSVLDVKQWQQGYRVVGQLTGFVDPPDRDSLVLDPETVVTRSAVVQHDGAGKTVRIWALPDTVADAGPIAGSVVKLATSQFQVFRKQDKVLITEPLRRGADAQSVKRNTDAGESRLRLCLLDVVSGNCASLPIPRLAGPPAFITLDNQGIRLAVTDGKNLHFLAKKVSWRQVKSLSQQRLGAPVLYATFVAEQKLFVMGEGGEALLWDPSTQAMERLPASYAPLANPRSVISWVSSDRRWIILNDMLRGVVGYRVDGAQTAQKFYPLNLPREVSARAATLGGRVTGDGARRRVAFGNGATDAILLETTADSLTIGRRELPGHDAPVTDLSLNLDGSRVFTIDNEGKARSWNAEAEQLTTLPIALPLDPGDRELMPDDGQRAQTSDYPGMVFTSDNQAVLLVGKSRGYGSYDVAEDSARGPVGNRRPAQLSDFPISISVPNSVALAAATAAQGRIDVPEGKVWEAEAFANGGALAALLTDATVRVYTAQVRAGRTLRTDANEPIEWQGHAADRMTDTLFVVAKDRTICRFVLNDAPPAQKCFRPAAGSDFGAEFGSLVRVVSSNRLLSNSDRLVILDEGTKAYSIQAIPSATTFCGSSGVLSKLYFYRFCEKEVVIVKLDDARIAVRRVSLNALVSAIWLGQTPIGTAMIVGDVTGDLAIFDIEKPTARRDGGRGNAAADFKKIADGKLDSGARINALLAVTIPGIGPDAPRIFTADSDGGVWRWDLVRSSAGTTVLEQAVRLHAHRGLAVRLASLTRNGKETWIASVGSDGLVLLSPDNTDALLSAADRVFDDIGGPMPFSSPIPDPPRRIDGTTTESHLPGTAHVIE